MNILYTFPSALVSKAGKKKKKVITACSFHGVLGEGRLAEQCSNAPTLKVTRRILSEPHSPAWAINLSPQLLTSLAICCAQSVITTCTVSKNKTAHYFLVCSHR